MDRLTDRPDMTLDVYRGRKTTIQQHSEERKSKNMIKTFDVSFKDDRPYLFHSFRNKYFNKISLGNMLYF